MKNKITTIKINADAKKRLDNFRVYRRETYNDILQKIFDILNICRLNPENARIRLMMLEKEKKRNFASKQNTQKDSLPQKDLSKNQPKNTESVFKEIKKTNFS